MQNSNFRPSILMDSKNPMKINDISQKKGPKPKLILLKTKKFLKI